jgi:hypothetical protein
MQDSQHRTATMRLPPYDFHHTNATIGSMISFPTWKSQVLLSRVRSLALEKVPVTFVAPDFALEFDESCRESLRATH